jgi:hypothetical protein
MLSQGVWNEELEQWVRHDKKECCICQNKYSTSPELFLVKFTEGEDLIYCNVCIGEGPLSEVPDEIISMTKVETTAIKNAPQTPQKKESYSAEWLNNNKDNEGNEIDWIDSKELKEMKQFREEKFTNLIESLDLLHDTSKLEAFTAILTEEQRDKLYSHPILNDYDLLP